MYWAELPGDEKSIPKRSGTAEEEGTTQLQSCPKNCQTTSKSLETRNLLTRQEGENEDIKIYKYKKKKNQSDSLVATVLSAFTFLWQDKTATGKVTNGEEDEKEWGG